MQDSLACAWVSCYLYTFPKLPSLGLSAETLASENSLSAPGLRLIGVDFAQQACFSEVLGVIRRIAHMHLLADSDS